MRILVTGGAGFIGSNVVDRYIDEGHTVAVVDDLSTGKQENLNPDAKFYKIGIEDVSIHKVFEEFAPDVVNHHAAQADVRKSVDEPIFDAKINVIGSLNILQNVVRYKVKKFIFISSGGAGYGEQDYFPADETHPLRPLSPYGVTKICVEKYLYFYGITYGLDYTVLRYGNVYGERQDPLGEAGVIAIFTEKMLEEGKPLINGEGKQTRDYIYVGDLVETNLLVLDKGRQEIYNVGTAIETDVNTLAVKLKDLTGYKNEVPHGPASLGEQLRSVISSEKAYKEFGWKPNVSLDEGLRRTVEWAKGQT